MNETTASDPALDRFLAALRPLLEEQGAVKAFLFGSWARGAADRYSDIDVIIVAETERPPVERFRDYLPAIVAARRGVDLFVYTPEEFAALRSEGRPFLVHALEGARLVWGRAP
jgi:predicted nucleotidyltransferase